MGIDSRFFKPNWESYPFFLFFSFFSITLKTPAGLLLLLLFQWLSLFLFQPARKRKMDWKYSQKKKKEEEMMIIR